MISAFIIFNGCCVTAPYFAVNNFVAWIRFCFVAPLSCTSNHFVIFKTIVRVIQFSILRQVIRSFVFFFSVEFGIKWEKTISHSMQSNQHKIVSVTVSVKQSLFLKMKSQNQIVCLKSLTEWKNRASSTVQSTDLYYKSNIISKHFMRFCV